MSSPLSVVPYILRILPPGQNGTTGRGRDNKKNFMDFDTYWTLFSPDEQFENRRYAAEQEWNRHPEKHDSIIAWLKKHGAYKGRNPYFFILDWQVKQPRQQMLSFNAYYAKFGTTEEQGGWKRVFIAEQQKTVYIRQ